ncbi:MAG TPA: SpoIIE family protein phosphatase [Sphingomicrobium sp.]|jgi:sigma-B regulation protein RsbU (phosphoserine phosphatase)
MAASEIPLRILVVEDDDIAAAYLALHLEQLGCRVEIAADGEAGLASLRSARFDVLITDWMMPRMNGVELIQLARGEVDHYLHVILITAAGHERTMKTALDAGADDFLYKPITPVQLELGITTVRRVIELQQRLARRNRSLASSMVRIRQAYKQLKADVDAAAAMQLSLIPGDGVTGELEHAAFIQPSIEMGGDSFGLIELPSGTFFFAIDVSGHGVPAALNSFAIHQRLVSLARGGLSLVAIAETINRELLDQPGDSYATALLCKARGGKMQVLRCGHPPPVLRQGTRWQLVEKGNMPLGLFPDAPFAADEIELDVGDRLVCYSDGVMESGMDELALVRFCADATSLTVDAFVSSMRLELARRRGDSPPPDDLSVLAVQRCEE